MTQKVTCPECGREIGLTRSGRISRHVVHAEFGSAVCSGSGALPPLRHRTVREYLGEMVADAMRTGGFVTCECCAGTGWVKKEADRCQNT